jgi:DNA-binding response OmpR family regulator
MGKKIAIIEDEPSISELYRLKLEHNGYEVQTTTNGKLGLELVEKMKPDLILLDLLMPEMTGEQMLTELRKKDWGKDIKVIILTNVSRQEAPESLIELEISRYIVKAEMTASQVAEIIKEFIGV